MANVKNETVRELLGGDELAWLVDRLRKRMSRGEPLTGTVQLSDATAEQRAAVARLMGRTPTLGRSVTVDLGKLSELLVHAQVCSRLEDAVEAIVGFVRDERAELLSTELQWEQIWEYARGRCAGNEPAHSWLEELRTSGLLKRFAAGDLQRARALLRQALSIVLQVPFECVRLAELAASETGNSHALDRGQKLGSLVVRFSRQLDESASWTGTPERRDAWETLGILCDELSAPVLVLNLRADNKSLTGRTLNLHADAGEPYRISVRQLRRHPPRFELATTGPDVFVSENPTVVDVAANRLGHQCKPLVCIDGQPKTASRLLLNALIESGCAINYHGDFDWEGIRIANKIVERHHARSWRFNATDYANVVIRSDYRLTGKAVVADWDPDLAPLMTEKAKCVHEEQVLNDLLADLVAEG